MRWEVNLMTDEAKDELGQVHQKLRDHFAGKIVRNDIVNISLHFFLEDIRSTLHPSMSGNTVVS